MVNFEDLEEEGSCFHIGDIGGTTDSVGDDDEEATTQHLHIASDNNLEDNTAGEECNYFHIGEIVTRRKNNSNYNGVASLTTATAPSAANNQTSNLGDNTLGEEISCFHIREIVTGKTLYSND